MSSKEPNTSCPADKEDIIHPRVLPFIMVHLACFGIIWVDVQPIDWILCGALYVVRMFGITAGFHRYFSHRSFKTGRVFQFFLAFLGQSFQHNAGSYGGHRNIVYTISTLTPTKMYTRLLNMDFGIPTSFGSSPNVGLLPITV